MEGSPLPSRSQNRTLRSLRGEPHTSSLRSAEFLLARQHLKPVEQAAQVGSLGDFLAVAARIPAAPPPFAPDRDFRVPGLEVLAPGHVVPPLSGYHIHELTICHLSVPVYGHR
jgi:hypothetical protein